MGFHPVRVRWLRALRVGGAWMFRRWPAVLGIGLPLNCFAPESMMERNPWIESAGVLGVLGLLLYGPWSWLIHSVWGVAQEIPLRTFPALRTLTEIEPPYLLYLRNFNPERVVTTETKPYMRYPKIVRVHGMSERIFIEGGEEMSTRIVDHPLPDLLRRVAGPRVVALTNVGDATPPRGIRHVAVPDAEWPAAAERLIRGAACIVFAFREWTNAIDFERTVIRDAGLGPRTLILTHSTTQAFDDLHARVICAPELTPPLEREIEEWIRKTAPEVVAS